MVRFLWILTVIFAVNIFAVPRRAKRQNQEIFNTNSAQKLCANERKAISVDFERPAFPLHPYFQSLQQQQQQQPQRPTGPNRQRSLGQIPPQPSQFLPSQFPRPQDFPNEMLHPEQQQPLTTEREDLSSSAQQAQILTRMHPLQQQQLSTEKHDVVRPTPIVRVIPSNTVALPKTTAPARERENREMPVAVQPVRQDQPVQALPPLPTPRVDQPQRLPPPPSLPETRSSVPRAASPVILPAPPAFSPFPEAGTESPSTRPPSTLRIQTIPPTEPNHRTTMPSSSIRFANADSPPVDKTVDLNEDGKITLNEVQYAAFVHHGLGASVTTTLFKEVDHDLNEYLSAAEFNEIRPLVLAKAENAALHYMESIDKNGDGKLSLTEAQAYILKEYGIGYRDVERIWHLVMGNSIEDMDAIMFAKLRRRIRGMSIRLARQTMKAADTNGDGFIDEHEARAVAYEQEGVGAGDTNEMISAVDEDVDGVLNAPEFADFERILRGRSVDTASKALRVVDKDASGSISLDESKRIAFDHYGFDEKILEPFFAQADENEDGKLDAVEFAGFRAVIRSRAVKNANEALKEVDTDHDGFLNGREAIEMARSQDDMEPQETMNLFNVADQDRSDKLDRVEFADFIRLIRLSAIKFATDHFREFDTNKDKAVTVDELESIIEAKYRILPSLTQQIFQRVDADDSGDLNPAEIVDFRHEIRKHVAERDAHQRPRPAPVETTTTVPSRSPVIPTEPRKEGAQSRPTRPSSTRVDGQKTAIARPVAAPSSSASAEEQQPAIPPPTRTTMQDRQNNANQLTVIDAPISQIRETHPNQRPNAPTEPARSQPEPIIDAMAAVPQVPDSPIRLTVPSTAGAIQEPVDGETARPISADDDIREDKNETLYPSAETASTSPIQISYVRQSSQVISAASIDSPPIEQQKPAVHHKSEGRSGMAAVRTESTTSTLSTATEETEGNTITTIAQSAPTSEAEWHEVVQTTPEETLTTMADSEDADPAESLKVTAGSEESMPIGENFGIFGGGESESAIEQKWQAMKQLRTYDDKNAVKPKIKHESKMRIQESEEATVLSTEQPQTQRSSTLKPTATSNVQGESEKPQHAASVVAKATTTTSRPASPSQKNKSESDEEYDD